MFPSARTFYFICLAAICIASARAAYIRPQAVKPYDKADVLASALTQAAGAAAAASKLDSASFPELDRYGLETGVPLLARAYGPLDELYAAALPPRSFVALTDPIFSKDEYSNIKHNTCKALGVAAL